MIRVNRVMFIAVSVATLLVCQAANAITFSDGTFNDSDWVLYVDATGAGTSKAYQASPGGSPGSYRKVMNTSESDDVIAFSYMINAKWNPGVLGAIAGIDGSFDHEDQLVGDWGQGGGIALRQNGKNYFGPSNLDYPASWQHASWTGLTSSDFRTLASTTDHPDFSHAGGQIMLGFFNSNTNLGIVRTTGSGYDNFQVTVTALVPEPPGIAALICALGATGGIAWRKRRNGIG